jgi:hypothetical protein
MQRELPELKIIDGSTEASHRSAGDIGVVLIARLINHVEVTHDDPAPIVSRSNVTQLVEEFHLLIISVGAIDSS